MRTPTTTLDRRALLRLTATLTTLTLQPTSLRPALADGETVGPASNFNRLQTGKPRPETGCVLVEEVQSTGDKKNPTVSAELVTGGGVAATVAFESPWPVARGMYYDVEARSTEGDSAYIHVRTLPDSVDLASVPASYLTSSVFNAYGRWSTCAPPPLDSRALGLHHLHPTLCSLASPTYGTQHRRRADRRQDPQ